MQNAGAFEGLDIVFMAHPTVSNAIQPMKARRDLFLTLHGHSHSQYVAIFSLSEKRKSKPRFCTGQLKKPGTLWSRSGT